MAVPGLGLIKGDVAWGGNWFFLAEVPGLEPDFGRRKELTRAATAIKSALKAQGITGADGAEIDHVELFGPPSRTDAQSRNFVLCPGGECDRSPCGTGTSAKMACLHAKGRLALGEVWGQESLTGSLFKGWLEERDGELVPFVQGRAFITAPLHALFRSRGSLPGRPRMSQRVLVVGAGSWARPSPIASRPRAAR